MGDDHNVLGERARKLGLSVRSIGPGDDGFLYKLYSSTREEELAPLDWSEEQKAGFLRMQFDAQHHFYTEQFTEARFDILERGGEQVGRFYVDRRAKEFRVIDIALLPEHRGGGLGGALMADLLDEAAAAGKPVSIHVERYNPAMHLYLRLGFVPIEDQGVYELMEWRADRSTVS
ncbi:MAG: GNAT family N-acetyltransferase [Pseudomonadota bacterium]